MIYRVEKSDNNWLVVTTAKDGIVDVLAEFTTFDMADAECRQWNRDYYGAIGEERRYQEMYSYACGYHD